MNFINKINLSKQIYGCLDAVIPLVLADLSAQANGLVFIARDDVRMARIEAGLAALSDKVEVLSPPGTDYLMTGCLRIPPSPQGGCKRSRVWPPLAPQGLKSRLLC